MAIQIFINGALTDVTQEQLFALAKRGIISPDTEVLVNGKKFLAKNANGIVFGTPSVSEIVISPKEDQTASTGHPARGREYYDGTLYQAAVPTISTSRQNINRSVGKTKNSMLPVILGVIGLVAWFIPLIGFPIVICGLVNGMGGYKNEDRGIAMTGLVLCSLGLALTIIHTVISVYLITTGQIFR